jgi:RHS repeat-associated protein
MKLIDAKIGTHRNNNENFEKQLSYVLDLVDNIRRITETKDSTTTTIETTINNRNQYTKFGNLNLSYDFNGNLKQKGNKNFTYDYKNQLVRYQDSEKTVEFRYDPFGRRIQKKATTNNQSQTTNYYYEGYRVIEERDNSDRVTKQYVYGSGIDELLRMDIYENQTPTPYYLHHNLISSVTGITDENGNLIELIEYDPYGKPYFLKPTGNPQNPYEPSESSTIGNTTLFQGREYDPETGLYYFRTRYYDPEIGRFLQPDPLGYQDSMNLYQAFNCNPVNYIDPYGTIISIERLRSLEEIELYREAIEELIQTEKGQELYEILQKDPRVFYIEFEMKDKASSSAGTFEIESLMDNQDFKSAVIRIFVATLKHKVGHELLEKGEEIISKDVISKNIELQNFLRFKGLKNIYQVIAEVMGHEFAHAVKAVDDPSRAVYIYKLIKEYDTITKDYLRKYKERWIDYIKREDVYKKYLRVLEMLAEEEALVTYPTEKRIYEEILERNKLVKNFSLFKKLVEKIKEILRKEN